jgi:hypothetical protein
MSGGNGEAMYFLEEARSEEPEARSQEPEVIRRARSLVLRVPNAQDPVAWNNISHLIMKESLPNARCPMPDA